MKQLEIQPLRYGRTDRRGRRSKPFAVGKKYRVPCVRATWPMGTVMAKWWPVMGELHEDNEHLNFPFYHWHIDWRFVPESALELRRDGSPMGDRSLSIRSMIARPLHIDAIWPRGEPRPPKHRVVRPAEMSRELPDGPRKLWYGRRLRTCYRSHPFSFGEINLGAFGLNRDRRPSFPAFPALAHAYRDQTLGGDNGMICPHRGYDLSSVPPDDDGIVECPLHGLRWCVRTGRQHEGDAHHQNRRIRTLDKERQALSAALHGEPDGTTGI